MTLRIDNLAFSYKTRTVFNDISMEVHSGQLLNLVGPNGAGKTTLLKCVNRLLKASTGTITVNGRDIKSLSRLELARCVAYVPQAALSQFPITVFDAVLLGRKPYLNWTPRQEDLDMVMEVLAQLELVEMAMRDINQLSGGERQKVVIAKAIVQEPQILLVDEPTTYLDLKYQLRIMHLIRELVDEKKICAVMTTHDLNLALQFSDRLVILKDGTIVADGGTNVLTEEVILQVYGVEARLHRDKEKPFMIPLKAIG